MASSIPEGARLYRRAEFVQAASQRLGVAHNLRGVRRAVLLHLAGGNQQRGQREEMMIAGCAGEDAAVSGRPVFLFAWGIQVAQDYTTLRAGKGFMHAGGQPGCALV